MVTKPLQVAPPHAVGLVIILGLVITIRKVFLPTASELADFVASLFIEFSSKSIFIGKTL